MTYSLLHQTSGEWYCLILIKAQSPLMQLFPDNMCAFGKEHVCESRFQRNAATHRQSASGLRHTERAPTHLYCAATAPQPLLTALERGGQLIHPSLPLTHSEYIHISFVTFAIILLSPKCTKDTTPYSYAVFKICTAGIYCVTGSVKLCLADPNHHVMGASRGAGDKYIHF